MNTKETVIEAAQLFLRTGEIKPALKKELDLLRDQYADEVSNLEALELYLDFIERNTAA